MSNTKPARLIGGPFNGTTTEIPSDVKELQGVSLPFCAEGVRAIQDGEAIVEIDPGTGLEKRPHYSQAIYQLKEGVLLFVRIID